MEELEVPTEHLHEHIHEAAHHSPDTWVMTVALCSALLAVFAAIASLLAGHHANAAMLEQLKASDQWAYYQAKGIKSSILETRSSVLEALGKPVDPKVATKLQEYKKEQTEIDAKAREMEASWNAHLSHHNILAKAVTFFQIGIALSAISVLTRRRWLFWGSLGLGASGLFFLVTGLV